MLDALTITEAEAEGLSELAALDLAMARDFAARAQAAEDPDVANDLARTYQRMARSYRQSLALKVRLRREMAQAARDEPPPSLSIPRDEARIQARVDDLRGPLQRVIWAEYEPADLAEVDPDDDICGYFFDLLEQRLALHAADNRFGLEPLDEHIVNLARSMTLSPELAARWRELPEPPEAAILGPQPSDDFDAAPDWRGSG